MFWAPAPGATSYDIYKNMIYEGSYIAPLYTVCRGNYYDVDDYYVVGVRGDEFGSDSQTLTVQFVFDWDYDDDGIVGWGDFAVFASDFGKDRSRSDADENGVVGFADFARLARYFGKCNSRPDMYPWSKVVVVCGS